MRNQMRPEVTRHYAGSEASRYHDLKRSIPPESYSWVSALRARKIASFVKPPDVVLEYGVGWGWNLASLNCAKKLGYDVTELLEPRLAEQSIHYVRDLQELADESIDLMVCHHVLEHLLYPVEALQKMMQLLKPGRQLLLFVPYEKERRYRTYDSSEPNHHLFSWNPQTLSNLIAELGYAVTSAGTGEFGYDRFAASWAVRLHLGERGFRILRKISHLIRPGLEVRIVATKPVGK